MSDNEQSTLVQIAEPITEDDSLSRRLARLEWLGEKIERGVATDAEVAEFQREYLRLLRDVNEAVNPIAEAYADAVTSVAEAMGEPMKELAKSFNFSPSRSTAVSRSTTTGRWL